MTRAEQPEQISASMSRLGVAAMLLGVLFAAFAGSDWLRQVALDVAAPPGFELPAAECPADELQEEGLSVAECEQLVAGVVGYLVSQPAWFAGVMSWLTAFGTLLAIVSVACGAALAAGRAGAARVAVVVFAALVVVDGAEFVAAQLGGPIVRASHLPAALLWLLVHLALAAACYTAAGDGSHGAGRRAPDSYGRFEVLSHWSIAVAVFFLFVSSWWMLALPLPSADFRFRELPFQLHKNLGITVLLLLIAMATVSRLRRRAAAALPGESARLRRLRIAGHVALYLLLLAVCVTGYLSSTYSGWSTTWWWMVDLPNWGREDEALNRLYSDLHLWSCQGLLLLVALHIGAALLHAFRNDGLIRRMLGW